MYLLIGISEVRIQIEKGKLAIRFAETNRKKPIIVIIPSSLWTAGCCVHSNGEVHHRQ